MHRVSERAIGFLINQTAGQRRDASRLDVQMNMPFKKLLSFAWKIKSVGDIGQPKKAKLETDLQGNLARDYLTGLNDDMVSSRC